MDKNKKYQVFVSSTFTDLQEERQAAVSAILKAGHIPAGMELFTAGDKSQWDIIKKWIDESDIYVLILGGRYGSIEKTSGLSYTELEYNYALENNKPLFSIVISDTYLDEKVRACGKEVLEQENPKLLRYFKEKVTSNLVSFFSDLKDIRLAVMESIPDVANGRDLSGWIHGRNVPDVNGLINEISKLNEDNGRLKREFEQLQSKFRAGEPINGDLKRIVDVLKSKNIDQVNNQGAKTFTFLQIFEECTNSLLHGLGLVRNPLYRKFDPETLLPAMDCFLLFDLVDKEFNGIDNIYVLSKKGRELSIYIDTEFAKNQSQPFSFDGHL